MFGLRAVVDRCGVIAGPWQMGKVDQGVFAHWLLSHHFGLPLSYIGYGGTGKQVRDLIHVADLATWSRSSSPSPIVGRRGPNVGGGRECSLSLLETTDLCRELTGREVPISAEPRGARATCRSTSRTARASSSAPTGVRPGPRGRRSPTWRVDRPARLRAAGQPRVRGGAPGRVSGWRSRW